MSYARQMKNIAEDYIKSHSLKPATTHEIAKWAIKKKRWQPQPSDLIRQCAEELSRAMREDYFIDPQGRRVRAKHVAYEERDGKQVALWADIRTASPKHMKAAFEYRRNQIIGDCNQLKADVDSYNENFNIGPAVQLSFDFSDELEDTRVLSSRSIAS